MSFDEISKAILNSNKGTKDQSDVVDKLLQIKTGKEEFQKKIERLDESVIKAVIKRVQSGQTFSEACINEMLNPKDCTWMLKHELFQVVGIDRLKRIQTAMDTYEITQAEYCKRLENFMAESENETARLKALELLGKVKGFYVERKEENVNLNLSIGSTEFINKVNATAAMLAKTAKAAIDIPTKVIPENNEVQ